MNKQNKILLGILAFIVACTIGYALFSESITISGTASASGDFKIGVYCTIGLEDNVFKEGIEYRKGDEKAVESGTQNDSCIVSGNTVSINTDLLYPSARRYYIIEMKNEGKMAVTTARNDMVELVTTNKYNSETDEFISQMSYVDDLYQSDQIGFKDAQDNMISTYLSDPSRFLIMDDPDNVKFILRPNESVYIYVMAEWQGSMDENGVYYSTEYELSYDFIQAQ